MDFHMKNHTGQRDFICDLCGERFLRKSNLERHVTVHSNPDRFECHICRKNFKRRDQLEGHLSWAHSDGPKFKCDYCDIVLPSMKRMWNHRVRHLRIFVSRHNSKTFVNVPRQNSSLCYTLLPVRMPTKCYDQLCECDYNSGQVNFESHWSTGTSYFTSPNIT